MAKKSGGGGFLIVVLVLGILGYAYYDSQKGSSAEPPGSSGPVTGDGTGRYVALGDSYTSSPRTGNRAGQPEGCDRSDNNYPSLVAADISPAEFVDVSCSGATTADLESAQETDEGTNPPQLDAVNEATTLVTIGIGGNDVGLIGLAGECGSVRPDGAKCRDRFTAGGGDELVDRINTAGDRLDGTIGDVKAKAPNARVVVVGYPTILPDGDGCWPTLPIGSGDVNYFRGILEQLNGKLAEVAASAQAGYVDTARPTEGHDLCTDSGDRWIEGVIPTSKAIGLHPNAKGSEAMADAVLRVVG
ncbi:GDSL family lipase [Amycolatopsis antarctica]|uniref:GDSL family lipase n=1 Tax=Amycolatopsis antarctica TaxID=1854586 RepID=A0A263DA09_9PSEU|nr:SGNH/GDSL hydrolase family protein [Amycolatopsis antarctica]OZM74828.1 GDSL family lipase [Amycolatopsis antarctica]